MIKRDKTILHISIWMNPENTLKQPNPKATHTYDFHLYEISGIGKCTETKSRRWFPRTGDGGEKRVTAT